MQNNSVKRKERKYDRPTTPTLSGKAVAGEALRKPNMNPNELRIVIAEACGWIKCKREGYEPFWMPAGYIYNESPYHLLKTLEELPDYPNDLNAMREAEICLNTPALRVRYINLLRDVVGRDIKKPSDLDLVMSSAPQRAEAFVRTIGKWKD